MPKQKDIDTPMKNIIYFVLSSFAFIFLAGCGTISAGVTHHGFGFFQRSLNHTSHGFNVVADPTNSAPTKVVDRFEVRPGDCSSDSVHSDCKTNRERSELAGQKNIFVGQDEWYGWYIYVPNDFKDVYPAHLVVGQFYQTDVNVAFALGLSNSGMRVENILKYKYSGNYDIDRMRGKWTKVTVHARWTSNDDGLFEVYVNDLMLYSYSGNTMYSGGNALYFKYGIYRSELHKLAQSPPTQIIYYSNVWRASKREDLFIR